MPPALVQSTAADNSNAQGSVTFTFSSPPTPGNLLVVVFCSRDDTWDVPTMPADWTRQRFATDDGSFSNGGGSAMFWKIAGAGEASAHTITKGSGQYCKVGAYEFSGIDTYDTSAASNDQPSSQNAVLPSITPVSRPHALLFAWYLRCETGGSWTPPADYTELLDSALNGGFAPHLGIAYRIVTAPNGATAYGGTAVYSVVGSRGWAAGHASFKAPLGSPLFPGEPGGGIW